MRLEKCILRMDKLSDEDSGKLMIPSEVFSNITLPCRFIAFKKKNSNFIKLLSIADPDFHVYEIYAEIEDGQLTPFIIGLTRLASRMDQVVFIPEVEGICPGGEGIPCTFDGFVLVKGDEEVVEGIKNELAGFTTEDDLSIVKHIEVERLRE